MLQLFVKILTVFIHSSPELTENLYKHSLALFIGWIVYMSVGKESACSAGDPGSIPGLGRSAGEGIGYPLQYSWASHVAQLIKNQSPVWENWV